MSIETFLQNNIPCAICITKLDKDFTITYANEEFYRIIGFSKSEIQYKFANRMSVLLGASNTKRIKTKSESKQLSTLVLEYEIKNATHNMWLHTQVDFSRIESDQCLVMISFDITRHKTIELNLKKFEKKSYNLFDFAGFDAYEYDVSTFKLRYAFSKNLFKDLPKVGTQFPDYFFNLIHPDSLDSFMESFELIKTTSTDFRELQIKDKFGEYKWFRSSLAKYVEKEDEYILHTLWDITAEKEATLNYLHETMFYQAMLSDQTAYGHIDVTENKILRVGGLWNLYNELIDKVTYTQLFSEFVNKVVHPDDRERYLEILSSETMVDSCNNGIYHLGLDFRRIVEQNKMSWMSFTTHLFKDPINGHVMALLYIKSVPNQKKTEAVQKYINLEHDALTRLYDQKSSEYLIEEYLSGIKEGEMSTLLLLEIKDFQHIKENITDEEEEHILIGVSKILNKTFRKSDIVGRYEQSKFIILLKKYDCDSNLRARLDRLLKSIMTQIKPKIAVNLGVSLVVGGMSYETSLKQSSTALFAAKYANTNGYVFYEEGLLNEETQIAFEEHHQHLLSEEVTPSTDTNEDIDEEIFNDFNALAGTDGDIGYLIDPRNYDLVCGNQAFYSRLGKTVDECKDKKCYELLHHRDTPCVFCRKSNWSYDKFYLYRNYNAVLDQEFLIKNKLVEWSGSEMLLAFAIDLSNDATVVDSIENETTENNYILNGIYSMQSAEDIEDTFMSALDTIGDFFRAESVRMWKYQEKEGYYRHELSWAFQKNNMQANALDENDKKCISNWLVDRKWNHIKVVETPEAMLCDSYDIYQIMKKNNVINQRWVTVNEDDRCIAIIEINNLTINFQNTTFMDSFISFMLSEFKKRQLVNDIIYNNMHDSLTGLLNRTSYEAFTKEYRSDNVQSVASICVNLNGLKQVNDLNGVNTGDYFLIKTTEFLSKIFPGENIYRLNGDEFIVIVLDKGMDYLENKLQQFKKVVKNFDLFTVSLGFAWDNIERNLNETINNSVSLMRINKKQFYLLKKEDVVSDYQNSQARVIESIQKREYEVWLQPKYNVKENKFFGAEALIRYRNQDSEIIPPSFYVPTLEKNNLIRYIDLFVFEEVCKMIQKWSSRGLNCPTISLNFSRKTLLEEELVEQIDNIFNKYKIPKEKIEIEVIESSADIGKAPLYEAIKRLHYAGYHVSLDDFGTNYSNLTILSDTDIDVLKIDKSLIHSLETERKNRIILKNIVQMCNELGVEVIAEGVEDVTQRDILMDLGCYLIQGYLYSKPVEVSLFEKKYMPK